MNAHVPLMKERLIVGLDVPTVAEAEKIADEALKAR